MVATPKKPRSSVFSNSASTISWTLTIFWRVACACLSISGWIEAPDIVAYGFQVLALVLEVIHTHRAVIVKASDELATVRPVLKYKHRTPTVPLHIQQPKAACFEETT